MKALALIVFLPCIVFATENNGRGTKALALANAFVAIADNPWATSYNAAGLAQLQSHQISAFYIPQQFGIPELKTASVAAACVFGPGAIGGFVEQFGFDLYKTTTLGLGYGYQLSPDLSFGATVSVGHFSIVRYGQTYTTELNIGFLGRPTSNIAVGFAATNLTAASVGQLHERLPQSLLLGLSYAPSGGFTLVTEIEKDIQFPLCIKAGIEKQLLGFLSLRCGTSNNPDKFSAGFELRYSSITFGYAGYSHPELGWTHQVEVTLQWDASK
jgi:long-subunit fatty acid transport protein